MATEADDSQQDRSTQLKMDIPDLSFAAVPLDPREVRAVAGPPLLPGRLLLGGPFWAPLPGGPSGDDPEIAAFRDDPAWRWVLGVMALSLHPDDGGQERFERAWVDVALDRTDGGEPAAVAWSMKPDRSAREMTRSTKVTLGPSLTIADIGIDAQVERGVERVLEDVSLEALNEKTASGRWVLRRTRSAELRGCTRLVMVVRAPRDSVVQARLDVGCVSARKRYVFFWPTTTHAEPDRVTTLP
ncbi:hypothetical protein [Streptomyces sp. NPDC050564]|uniref:hypothetical protein n=1 Tax=Streptomyces sp. NPDC050564 TaxID=3365631 RepID=UPI0037B8B9D1